MKQFITIVLLAFLASHSNADAQSGRPANAERQGVGAVERPAASPAPKREVPPSSQFKCDGRTYCSQMTSCAEAKFFLKYCPGVKMDGNNDGVPCEKQWCR